MNKAFSGKQKFVQILLLIFIFSQPALSSAQESLEAALANAIRNNNSSAVEQLLKAGGNELTEKVGMSAAFYLEMAARSGSSEILKALTSTGKFSHDKTAFSKALIAGMENSRPSEIAGFLLEHNADPNFEHNGRLALNTLIMMHADSQNQDEIYKTTQMLIKHGAYVDSFDENGETPLMTAVRKKNKAMVQALVNFGASPERINKDGKSAATYAQRDAEISSILQGARKTIIPVTTGLFAPKNTDSESSTMQKSRQNLFSSEYSSANEAKESVAMLASQLSFAASSGDVQQIKELLQKGVNADAKIDSSGITALIQASNREAAEILIKSGANVKIRDNYGCNVLHHLAMRKSTEAHAELLIKSGAEVEERNEDGQTPLRCCGILFTENIAPDWGAKFIRLLVKAGASIDSRDKNGMTLLHQAAHNDNERLAATCLKLKASLQIKDSSGESPLQAAMRLNSKNFQKAAGKKK